MSIWGHINGIIEVSPIGRSQEEKDYVLKTILNHLPIKDYMDGHMNVYINVKISHTSFNQINSLKFIDHLLHKRHGSLTYETSCEIGS